MSNIYICGDLHGSYATIAKFYTNYIQGTEKEFEKNWIILLGDAGCQYYLGARDDKFKLKLSEYPFSYFIIRGNHEKRASEVAKTMPNNWETIEIFGNSCLREKHFPNIYYAKDEGGIYNIEGRKTLVLPGAYSVDKHYRLLQRWNWFEDEQLTVEERNNIKLLVQNQKFDLILSHTCPYDWRPTDLFLNCIDQSNVDTTMEVWMDEVRTNIPWGIWLFGHYHADRIERPHAEMFYYEVEDLNTIEERWKRYDETGELDWWLPKSPNFYME